jgi:hypothetical protein
MIRLTAQHITLDASADGEPSRQITGLAVPWNVKATLSGGESVVFLRAHFPKMAQCQNFWNTTTKLESSVASPNESQLPKA